MDLIRLPLILQFGVVPPHQVASDVSLEVGKYLRQTLVTHVLKLTEHTGTEEDLGMAQSVLILVELKSGQNLLSHDLAVNESLRHHIRGQDGVSGRGTQLIELLSRHTCNY